MIHALKWLPWADAGFPTTKERCPYAGYREMRRGKHKPKPEIESMARQLLDETTPKIIRNMNTSQDETHIVTAIRFITTEEAPTLVGKIDGYSGAVWYSPENCMWMMTHHPLEQEIDKN